MRLPILSPMLFVIVLMPFAANAQGLVISTDKEIKNYKTWDPGDTGDTGVERVDLRNTLPVPGKQGGFNSCVAWAVAYAAKSHQEALDQNWNPDAPARIFSPTFLWNRLNDGKNKGSKIAKALKVLAEDGCCTLKTFPYDRKNRSLYKAPITEEMKKEAKQFRISNYAFLRTKAQIQKALQLGHVVMIAITTDPQFSSGKLKYYDRALRLKGEKLVKLNGRGSHGKHALCVVGYDNARKAFLIMNSWGTTFGDQGFMWISYDLMATVPNAKKPGDPDEFIREAWIAEDIYYSVNSKKRAIDVLSRAQYNGLTSGKPQWMVTVSLKATKEALGQVETVVWKLPRGEKIRARAAVNWRSAFAQSVSIRKSGPGSIDGLVVFKDGRMKAIKVDYKIPKQQRNIRLEYNDRYWGLTKKFKKPSWKWSLRIAGNSVDIADIESVHYDLGPTWKNSKYKRLKTNPQDNFLFTMKSYTATSIKATVTFKNKQTQTLNLVQKYAAPVVNTLRLANSSRFLGTRRGKARWSWSAFVEGPMAKLKQVATVEYELHRTFKNRLRKGDNNLALGFPLHSSGYGTFEIKATVTMKDGKAIQLSHQLKFTDAKEEEDSAPKLGHPSASKKAPSKVAPKRKAPRKGD
ncbi:MAG: C1 family peptidase [Planctomycetota bacterium]|nr:C1 family peptidase [Planctomycetota bacterium]